MRQDAAMRGTFVQRVWTHDETLHAPARYRRACAYDAFVPDPLGDLDLKIGGELTGILFEAEARIATLNQTASPALAPLARLLLRTESVASSKVEGIQVDARALARGEVAHDTGRPVGPDVAGVIANIDAMQFAIETATAGRDVGPTQFTDIHRVLMERSMPARAGKLRNSQGWIGGNDYNPCGAAYVPPPEDEIPRLLDDLGRFSNDDRFSPSVQAAIAHAQFETIHPFDDGNGRTGRALVQVIVRRRGLSSAFVPPVSIVLASEKERYIRGLVAFREGDLEDWLEIFASALARSADLAQRYLARVMELQESWRQRLRDQAALRSDAAAWAIIDVLPGSPVITVAVALAALAASGRARSRAAVQVAVDQLEGAGVLRAVSASKRNRAWEAEGLLDLVTLLEDAID